MVVEDLQIAVHTQDWCCHNIVRTLPHSVHLTVTCYYVLMWSRIVVAQKAPSSMVAICCDLHQSQHIVRRRRSLLHNGHYNFCPLRNCASATIISTSEYVGRCPAFSENDEQWSGAGWLARGGWWSGVSRSLLVTRFIMHAPGINGHADQSRGNVTIPSPSVWYPMIYPFATAETWSFFGFFYFPTHSRPHSTCYGLNGGNTKLPRIEGWLTVCPSICVETCSSWLLACYWPSDGHLFRHSLHLRLECVSLLLFAAWPLVRAVSQFWTS